jgi:hypothetical protein
MSLFKRDTNKGVSLPRGGAPQGDAVKVANDATSAAAPKSTQTNADLAAKLPSVELPAPASQETQTDQQLSVENEFSSFTQTIINNADLANPLQGLSQKQIKKLKRVDLLELLVAQGEEIENLRVQLNDAKTQLENREIAIKEAGSIAEASLKLNRIFQDAQAAADQYLQNVKRQVQDINAVNHTQKQHLHKSQLIKQSAYSGAGANANTNAAASSNTNKDTVCKAQPAAAKSTNAAGEARTTVVAKGQIQHIHKHANNKHVYVVSNNPRARKKAVN